MALHTMKILVLDVPKDVAADVDLLRTNLRIFVHRSGAE
jgi:hypothetical protein